MRHSFTSSHFGITEVTPGFSHPARFIEADNGEVELHIDVLQPIKLSTQVHGAGDTIASIYGVDLMLFTVHMDNTLVCICANPADPKLLTMLKKASSRGKLVYVITSPAGKGVHLAQHYMMPFQLEELLLTAQRRPPTGQQFFEAYSMFRQAGGTHDLAASRATRYKPVQKLLNALVDPFGSDEAARRAVQATCPTGGAVH